MDNVYTDAFKDVSELPIVATNPQVYGIDNLNSLKTLQVGTGNYAFKIDKNGMWLGANSFDDAIFSVTLTGDLVIRSAASGARITISSVNKNIIVNDGTNDRVLIGYQSGGF